MALCEPFPRAFSPAVPRRGATAALAETALLALLYAGYSAARMIGDADVTSAVGHAHDLLRLEGMLGLDVELASAVGLVGFTLLPMAPPGCAPGTWTSWPPRRAAAGGADTPAHRRVSGS